RMGEQIHEHEGQVRRIHNSQGVAIPKRLHDIAKILGVRADHDCCSILCRFDDVVTTAWNQASADEGDVGEGVERSKFSHRVKYKDAARERFGAPERAQKES